MVQALNNLEKQKLNPYEAVIIAAKRARVLNEKLKKEQEKRNLFDEPLAKNGVIKVASLALKELLEGKVKFIRENNN